MHIYVYIYIPIYACLHIHTHTYKIYAYYLPCMHTYASMHMIIFFVLCICTMHESTHLHIEHTAGSRGSNKWNRTSQRIDHTH